MRPSVGVIALGLLQSLLSGCEAGEVKSAELEVRHRDLEGSKLGSQNFSECREGGAYCCFGGMEGRVDGGNNRWREDNDFW